MTKEEANKFVREWYDSTEWCWCGSPTAVMDFVHRALRLINEESDGDWETWYAGRVQRETELFGNNPGAQYFAYYVMERLGLTEHGGSVPGWLDKKGHDLLAALNECDINEALRLNE